MHRIPKPKSQKTQIAQTLIVEFILTLILTVKFPFSEFFMHEEVRVKNLG